MPRPAYDERIQWSPNCHTRPLGPIDFGALHTQEGDGTAASLANFLCNPSAEVSYHYSIDNQRNVVCVVDTDDASWSVGNANERVINVCFAGSRAGWSRQQWLSNMGAAIEIAAWLQVNDAIKYRFDAVVRGWDELKRGLTGLTDHRGINEGVLRASGHTDCGPNFPWDIYASHVNRFRDEILNGVAVAPAPNAIEACRAANEWLGAKVEPLDKPELPTPDKKGRFAHYENGSIYWTPDVDGGKAAFAVATVTRDKWKSLGWETGYLGYPAKPKLDLLPFDHSDGTHVVGGIVQNFQGGLVYASEHGTWAVRGLVKDRYASLGYETGPLGWPLSDEVPWGDSNYGGSTQTFERGVITWINQGNSTVALTDVGKVIFPFR